MATDGGAPLGLEFFDLSREEQEEILRPRRELQDMIREFNRAFPPEKPEAFPKWLSPHREIDELEALREEINAALG